MNLIHVLIRLKNDIFSDLQIFWMKDFYIWYNYYLSKFAKGSENKYEFEETEIGTNKDSETTNISAESSERGSVEVLKPLENFEPLLNKHETIIREEYEKNSQNER